MSQTFLPYLCFLNCDIMFIMHDIRKEIFNRISKSKKSRYSDLKPKDLDGNIFTYHLKSLISEGYIEKSDDLYTLSSKGKHLMDRVSSTDLNVRIQPKIITVIILKKGDKYLLYKRKKQPFIDHIGFPYGKIHIEEKLEKAALRELSEKTGLKAKLKYRGHAYFTVHNETELVSSMFCHIFTGSQIEGELSDGEGEKRCFWAKIEDFPKNNLLPGVYQMEKIIKENPKELFFIEASLNTTDED